MQPRLVRALVLDVFTRTHDQKELVDRALDRALRANPQLHSRERRLVSEAVFTMIRLVRRLDFVLEQACPRHGLPKPSTLPTPEQHRLRFALALASELEHTPDDAARLAGCDAKVGPMLAGAIRNEPKWPSDAVERLAVQRSLPDWLAKRFHDEYGASADALLAAMNERAPLSIRANTLKIDRPTLARGLVSEKAENTEGKLSPWALTLEGRPNVFGLAAFKAGHFEVQDEGSQLIALATGAQPGQVVIDACAGGGGKALALAAMMKNKGTLVACDVSEGRLHDIPERARRAGVFCLKPLVVDPSDRGEITLDPYRKKADVVLVDAPCSGTGAWRRNPDARWRLSPAEADAFAETQLSIVKRFSRSVKPGGTLVYATCSLLRAENEAVVERFLAEGGFQQVPAQVPEAARDANGFLRVRPDVHGTDGFFAAVLQRS